MIYFTDHFEEFLIIGLVLALFFKETLGPVLSDGLRKLFGLKNGKPEIMPDWASRLTAYVNHEQTERIDRISESMSRLLELEGEEHERAQEMRDLIRDISRTMEEIRREGVRCRTS